MKNNNKEERSKYWRRVSAYGKREIINKNKFFKTVRYRIKCEDNSLKGLKIVFFSDLHWEGCAQRSKTIKENVNGLNADIILFGGDLVAYSCHLDSAMKLFSSIQSQYGKYAVLGNWDRRRRRWFPNRILNEYYQKAGVRLLINESSITENGVLLYGADDFKMGIPRFPIEEKNSGFRIILSHNPDTVVSSAPLKTLSGTRLVLCGHTHGGQIRLPIFGSVKTSSVYWKKFDYGKFEHIKTGTEMIVSSGTGTSALPLRILCDPEILLIELI